MPSVTDSHQPQQFNRRRMIRFLLALPVFFAVCLFLPAGTWAWEKGWLFILVLLVVGTFCFVVLWRVNPEVLIARSHSQEGTKRWDKILVSLFLLAFYAIMPVAALDDGRFRWLPVPWWVCGFGYVLFLVGTGIMTWAQAECKFFEVTVRIQTDRGHRVIDTGPYAVVRHPGYVSGCMLSVGIALALGSLWALIPVCLGCLVMIVRTRWEDQTLQEELAGYKEYTERVRSKLIPGVW